MNDITKVSEITIQDLAEYLRIPEMTSAEENTLKTMLGVAKAYISNHTGRTESELDLYQDFVAVCLVLVQDMYDTRTLYVNGSNLNHVVETILGMHAVNLLPVEEVES